MASKLYYDKNREREIIRARAYYKANREKVLAKARAKYEANREKFIAKSRSYCAANREQRAVAARSYYKENRDRTLAAKRAYYEANRNKKLAYARVNQLRRAYGLTPETLAQMVSAQGNKCAICSLEFSLDRKVCVDHCHKSGRVRGALCSTCNSGIGHLKDDASVVRRALAYLEKFK